MVLLVGVFIVVYTVAGGSPTVARAVGVAPKTLTVSGALELDDFRRATIGRPCTGTGGYSDIHAGAAVIVSDATSRTVALGDLSPGVIVDTARVGTVCHFEFSVSGVPAGQQFYGVEISHRGRVQYTEADLAEPIGVTLGDGSE